MPFMTQLKSFDGTYWWCNWMELIERFAYYGVRLMPPVFMVDSLGKGGPELTQIQKGNIFAFALAVQSFGPILSGGFAGPLLAGSLRILDYEYVFLACSAAIALNFIPLLFFEEPVHPHAEGIQLPGPGRMLLDSVRGLLEPRLFFDTIASLRLLAHEPAVLRHPPELQRRLGGLAGPRQFPEKHFLIPLSIILVIATIWHFSVGLLLNTFFFCLMLVFALTSHKPAPTNH